MSGVAGIEIAKAMSSLEQLKQTDLSRFHTRQLMSMLRMRPIIWYDWEIGLLEQEEIDCRHEYKQIIKAELATREHVPNKKERRAQRLFNVRRGSSRGRRDKQG